MEDLKKISWGAELDEIDTLTDQVNISISLALTHAEKGEYQEAKHWFDHVDDLFIQISALFKKIGVE